MAAPQLILEVCLGLLAGSDAADMQFVSYACGGIQVEVFHHRGSAHANQDRWLLHMFDDVLRVAAIDGVTPWSEIEFVGDAAQWAAATCVKHLLLPGALSERLSAANCELHDPAVVPSRRQSMAAVAAADLTAEDGRLVGVYAVAADCEVWEAGDELKLVAGGEFVRPDVLAHLIQRRELWGSFAVDARRADEAALLECPGTQLRHAVGRYAAPVFSVGSLCASQIVLASDGARLGDAAARGVQVSDLAAWLEIVAGEPERDDLVCVVVSAV